MKSFFKVFFASLLALIIFFGILFFIFIGIIGRLAAHDQTTVASKSVLVIDLSKHFPEQPMINPIASLRGDPDDNVPGLYSVVRLINMAATDSSVKGIYLLANENANGFATSLEIRNALLAFKKSKKFLIAYGDYFSQKSYYVSTAADKIYCNPQGGLDWKGFSAQLYFIKNALKKLEIEPQIFYDGRFKSATEPLREEKMTEANRIQTNEWLGSLYADLLMKTSESRGVDTATLHAYANAFKLRSAADAVDAGLLDGARYDDEVKDEIRRRLKIEKNDRINFITLGSYEDAVTVNRYGGSDRIALIYAEGDITYGRGDQVQIGSDDYRTLIRRARMDKATKAIVLRVNSPGGSSIASDIIWREVDLCRKEGKPIIVSMGDYAASGGYYIACAADSIFAEPNTITGSIGVFSIIPNLQGFFNHKLGVNFDGVKTAPYADAGNIARPLTDAEKRFFQNDVDSIYADFKARVSQGRKMDPAMVDSIAQGRVWTGEKALSIGLVDKLGGIGDALACAARMAHLKEYSLREYPEPKSPLDLLFSNYKKYTSAQAMQKELGEEGWMMYNRINTIKQQMGKPQARMPFDMRVE